jgi:hypothetical protein
MPAVSEPTGALDKYFVLNYDGVAIHLWKVVDDAKVLVFARLVDFAGLGLGSNGYIGFTGLLSSSFSPSLFPRLSFPPSPSSSS